ncbi:regulatory P domain-containing protein [Spizellomyces punctatus DAOM BR117]|uniref:Regulatory P domain-containing protein n=1 Tax=Spizellomyces punctatus (strain DAOM BR117) TaxID=645134 RepID=A0A0L0HLX2_SPIPD|nr:regulatory P domain-containing protein [Spizellomyces punctatus DAOM BR117]KND02087.1 regulatory P domain-containing protein [Spizellomyces punctatus DAOM BR117]|eukprot:XP_016610126.1 regulatory P domain-containing protein [Spizellomyces punctatus DAOM BR117]
MKAWFITAVLVAPLVAALPPVPKDGELHCIGACQQGDPNSLMGRVLEAKKADWEQCETSTSLVCKAQQNSSSFAPTASLQSVGYKKCANGFAGDYPCKGVDLLSFIPHTELGSQGNGNDIWGWTDPTTKREYAIIGQTDGTAFVDITSPSSPIFLGRLASNVNAKVPWRDIKVFKDHAFIVADDSSNAHACREVGKTHNIAINEETGFAYLVGSRTCNSGLHMVDINTPAAPKFVGCASSDGYTHDVQVVNYKGPDSRYRGREIAFASNEDTVTFWDVTDKSSPKILSRTGYTGAAYTHQGWLTEDHQYFLVDDELDEKNGSDKHTKTYIWDVRSLTAPKHIGTYSAPVTSIDHNLYIKGNYAYLANYGSGLRVLDISKVAQAKLQEVAYFDVTPEKNEAVFEGSWSSYIYFPSGNIVVNSIERGFFVVKTTTI